MTVPQEYQRATDDFIEFLRNVRNAAGLGSTHQAYTMTQAVLQVFRRRLEPSDAIRFAQVLPTELRALFVDDWEPTEPCRPFEDRTTMTEEVHTLRPDHNCAPETAIQNRAHVAGRGASVLEVLAVTSPYVLFWNTDRSRSPCRYGVELMNGRK